ncbi:glycosyltransferase family 4 protein [Candidatus Gottesmanbacteria bacterium]|nr:glycosyltransferase family 4 protein [Candidatus Gottesmanbacteria bacterium]
MKKCVALVVYSHYSRDARVRRYGESLERSGYSVDVISLADSYEEKKLSISFIQFPLPRMRLGKLWYIAEYFLFFLFTTWKLMVGQIKKNYQFIHVNNMPDFLVFAAFVPKLFGAKIILDIHDPMPELYMSKYHVSKNNFVVKILCYLERISIQFSDSILTANPVFKEILLKRNAVNEKKITVILNCPDTRIFSTNNARIKKHSSKFTLLYMGTVDERFGLDIAIEAILTIVKRIPKVQFIIIPKLEREGMYFSELRNMVIGYGLSKQVLFYKPLPLDKIAEALKNVDIGVVLAKDGIFPNIIFPVKLLEFIQMGVPVIATKTTILSRYFDQTMIFFLKENTPKEFSDAVWRLYSNEKLRKSLVKNAKKYFTKHNWNKEESKYHAVVTKLLHQKSNKEK